jgi:hypothetical protein
MALGAFFDESEADTHDDPLSVAGYVFKPRDYERFDRQWRRMLRNAPGGRLPFIHMKDLFHGQKTAKDRTFAQRRDIINQASQLIADYMLCGAGVQFRQDEFEREAPTNWPEYFGSIYGSACQLCMRSTVHWLTTNNVAGSVVYAFEKGHKRAVEADRIITGVCSDPAARRKFRYKSHFFAEKPAAAGLQASDMLAWLGTQIAVNRQFSDAGRVLVEKYVRDSLGDHRYFVANFTGPRLRKFIDQQLNAPLTGPFDVGIRKKAFR